MREPVFRDLVVNPPRDDMRRRNMVMGGPEGPNMALPLGTAYGVEGLPGQLSIKTVRRGRGVWITADGAHCLDEGFGVILNDDQPYSFELAADEPVETFCAFFRPGFLGRARRAAGAGDAALLDAPEPDGPDAEFPERLIRIPDELDHALRPLYRQVQAEAISPLAWDEAFVRLAETLIHFRDPLRTALSPETARASIREETARRLGRAIDFIHANAERSLELADIAGAAALSPFHFHRLFKAATGRAPHAYVTNLRLQRAARLLARTDAPVTEVCLAVGFESLGSFSSLFRRVYGAPPTTWRRTPQDRRSAPSRLS